MSVVLHHGGAGTTAAALRAGKPSLILPLTADQGFWARRVFRLGAAPPPLRKRTLREDLRAGLRQLRDDPSIRLRAKELGERISSEDGTGRAVEEILRHIFAHR